MSAPAAAIVPPGDAAEPWLPPEAPLKDGEIVGRFVMSFATKPEDVERLIATIAD